MFSDETYPDFAILRETESSYTRDGTTHDSDITSIDEYDSEDILIP
jgi:hypothetical protein